MSNKNGHHVVQFGSASIDFRIRFRERKRLAIHVHPDKSVEVIAPKGRRVEEIVHRVRKRAGWILKQQEFFEQFQPLPLPRRYVAGETHLYLGRQYRLKIQRGGEETVKLAGRHLIVSTRSLNSVGRTSELVDAWYRDHAVRIFERRLSSCLEHARPLRSEEPNIIVRRMKTRWGSCTRAANLVLNTELVRAPLDCIDYVIVHELCHLRVRRHSPAFYRLLGRCLPDWERRKKRLDRLTF